MEFIQTETQTMAKNKNNTYTNNAKNNQNGNNTSRPMMMITQCGERQNTTLR